MPELLQGVRVLELAQLIAGPLCGLSLRDWGADVVKVEGPEGDYTRSLPPDLPSGDSAYFQMLNRGKRGVVLDLRRTDDRATARRLVDWADVVVDGLGDAGAELGLDAGEACARDPRLVWCAITGYGRGERARAIDPSLQASMGMMALNGDADGPPQRLPVPVVDYMTGMYATQSVLAALMGVERGGSGGILDCAMVDAAATLASSSGVFALGGDVPLRRMGSENLWYVPAANFEAADGRHVQVMAISEHHWRVLARCLGHPEWIDMPEYVDNASRVANRARVHSAVATAIRTAPAEHWAETITQAGGFCEQIVEIEEAWADPRLAARGLLAPLEEAGAPSFPIPRASLVRTPEPSAPRRAPRLGEHTGEIAHELQALTP